MPSCVMRKCTNYASKSKKEHGITYHKFPADELMRHEWVVIVRKQRSEHDWMPSNASAICSVHFDSKYKYTSDKGRILLKKTAVPFLKKHENPPVRCDSPNSLEDVDISNMDTIFDTQRVFALKKRVRLLTAEKDKIQKRNKVLKRHNDRLKKRISSLKSLVKMLKQKNDLSLPEQEAMEPEVIIITESTESS